MELKIILIIFIVLIVLDKGLTVFNILLVNKNFPEATKNDYYVVEKNPLAKWFFREFGLINGSIVYGFISLLTLFIAYFLLTLVVSDSISLYLLFIAYSLVILNNLYFLLKFAKIIT